MFTYLFLWIILKISLKKNTLWSKAGWLRHALIHQDKKQTNNFLKNCGLDIKIQYSYDDGSYPKPKPPTWGRIKFGPMGDAKLPNPQSLSWSNCHALS